jgi:hypothetical protein
VWIIRVADIRRINMVYLVARRTTVAAAMLVPFQNETTLGWTQPTAIFGIASAQDRRDPNADGLANFRIVDTTVTTDRTHVTNRPGGLLTQRSAEKPWRVGHGGIAVDAREARQWLG